MSEFKGIKGFIEVTLLDSTEKRFINITYLKEFQCYTYHPTLTMNNDDCFKVKETYEEVKELIRKAQ